MGSIPVRSTKNDECSLASVIFFVVFHEFDLGSSIRQSRILAEGLPLAGNGKFPFYQIFLRLSFAGAPACGKRQIPIGPSDLQSFFLPSDEKTCCHFFSRRMKRLVVIFSKYCSTRKLPFLRQGWTGLYRMPDKNKTNRGLTASFWLIRRYARGLYVKY